MWWGGSSVRGPGQRLGSRGAYSAAALTERGRPVLGENVWQALPGASRSRGELALWEPKAVRYLAVYGTALGLAFLIRVWTQGKVPP